jgi:hypothetical protein
MSYDLGDGCPTGNDGWREKDDGSGGIGVISALLVASLMLVVAIIFYMIAS